MNVNVRLKLARLEFFSGGGFTGSYAPLLVKVKNIAYSKSVSIHYTTDNTTWKDFSLTFLSHHGNYDVFHGTVNGQVKKFVVRYAADGILFYDNNNGQNYHFGPDLATVGGNVILNIARARKGQQSGGGFVFVTSWLEGEILVKNLSYAKEVGIRISLDGGANWQNIPAAYSGSVANNGLFIGAGAEVWKFKTPELNFDNSSPEFRFAVFYRNVPTGAVYWDNNFGQDYKVNKAEGATVE